LTVNDLTLNAQQVLNTLYSSGNTDDLQINYLMLFKLYSSYNEVLNQQPKKFNPRDDNPYYRNVQTALMRHIEDIFNENLTPEIWFFNIKIESANCFDKIKTIFNHIFTKTTETKYRNLAIKSMDYIRAHFLEIQQDISQETIESILSKKNLKTQCLELFQQLKVSSGLQNCQVHQKTISLESRLLDALSDQITHDELATIQTKYQEEAILQDLTSYYNKDKFAYYVITNSNENLKNIVTKNPELTLNILEEFLLFLQFLVYSIVDSLGFEGFELPQTPEILANYKVLGSSDE
jgi:hypothetical protein